MENPASGLENCQKFLDFNLNSDLEKRDYADLIEEKDIPLWAKERFPKACKTGPITVMRIKFWKDLLSIELMLSPTYLHPCVNYLLNNVRTQHYKKDIEEYMNYLNIPYMNTASL